MNLETPSEDSSPLDTDKPDDMMTALGRLWRSLRSFWSALIDLRDGLDREGTIVYIQNNKRMRGANAWLLMCSIMIASLGLDKESPAIIIGAMLISPLMSPILGVGLSFGINDRRTLGISLRHFGISIVIALFTSIVYFLLTPLGEFNSEMASRTKPDFLDGLVAIFGGTAGIISVSRKDKSNAIPGVAIATALMPPLCVAGYGIANGQWQIFREAIYLFFLNSFFISMSTYIIVKLLQFEAIAFQDAMERRRTNMIMIGVTIIFIIPSILILNRVIGENHFKNTARAFVIERFNEKENLLSYEPLVTDSLLIVRLFGTELQLEEIKSLEAELRTLKYHKNTRLQIVQEDNPGTEELALLRSEFTNVQSALSDITKRQAAARVEASEYDKLKQEYDLILPDTSSMSEIYAGCKIWAPSIESMAIGRMSLQSGKSYRQVPTAAIKWSASASARSIAEDEDRLRQYLMTRMSWDTVIITRL